MSPENHAECFGPRIAQLDQKVADEAPGPRPWKWRAGVAVIWRPFTSVSSHQSSSVIRAAGGRRAGERALAAAEELAVARSMPIERLKVLEWRARLLGGDPAAPEELRAGLVSKGVRATSG
jgi:hypothetical protein